MMAMATGAMEEGRRPILGRKQQGITLGTLPQREAGRWAVLPLILADLFPAREIATLIPGRVGEATLGPVEAIPTVGATSIEEVVTSTGEVGASGEEAGISAEVRSTRTGTGAESTTGITITIAGMETHGS